MANQSNHFLADREQFCAVVSKIAIATFERVMNYTIRYIAQRKWHTVDWFEKCKTNISKDMMDRMNPSRIGDFYILCRILECHFEVFLPPSLKKMESLQL
jgi:hypothetical protein